jgi:RNA polymerase sigma-70 factor (ECF subfamily)
MDPEPESSAWAVEFQRALQAAKNGDHAAIGVLLERFRSYLNKVATLTVDDDLQAKAGGSDFVQQTFLEASAHFPRFQGKSEEELKAWLVSILKNNLLDFRRQYFGTQKRQVKMEAPSSHAEALVSAALSPSAELLAQEQIELLKRALKELSEKKRELILLQHQGLTFPEIGARLGCSEDAARKQWSRTIEELRDLIRGYNGGSSLS